MKRLLALQVKPPVVLKSVVLPSLLGESTLLASPDDDTPPGALFGAVLDDSPDGDVAPASSAHHATAAPRARRAAANMTTAMPPPVLAMPTPVLAMPTPRDGSRAVTRSASAGRPLIQLGAGDRGGFEIQVPDASMEASGAGSPMSCPSGAASPCRSSGGLDTNFVASCLTDAETNELLADYGDLPGDF